MDYFVSFESLVIHNEVINEGLMSKNHIETPAFEAVMTMMTLKVLTIHILKLSDNRRLSSEVIKVLK